MEHELVHRTDIFAGNSAIPKNFTGYMKPNANYTQLEQYREYRGHMRDMQIASQYNLSSRYYYSSLYTLRTEYGYIGKALYSIKAKNLWFNLFR
jgi:hypothetical protein